MAYSKRDTDNPLSYHYYWADNRLLPARLTGPEVCQVLGYTEKDINILVKANHLKPLARKPHEIKSRKWKFATVRILELASDIKWLDKAETILHNWHDGQPSNRMEDVVVVNN